MKIAILAVNETTIRSLTKSLGEYSVRKTVRIDVSVFKSFKNFLNSEDEFDILFVDDYPDRRTAVETARLLRSAERSEAIVIISGNPRNVYEAFTVKAHRYLLLPFSNEMLYEALDSFRVDQLSKKCILVKTEDGFKSFKIRDLIYISADSKYCLLNTRRGVIKSITPFTQVLNQLPAEDFFPCHRSYIVNLSYISEFDCSEIYTIDGAKLPLSRRRKSDFFLRYTNYTRSHNFT